MTFHVKMPELSGTKNRGARPKLELKLVRLCCWEDELSWEHFVR